MRIPRSAFVLWSIAFAHTKHPGSQSWVLCGMTQMYKINARGGCVTEEKELVFNIGGRSAPGFKTQMG